MNRYNFNKITINKIKAYLKDDSKPKPSVLNKYSAKLKNGKLLLGGRELIALEDIDTYLRKLVTSGTVPLTRDGLYYYLSSRVAGISRMKIDNFLKKQRVIRETDNAQPTNKKTVSRRIHKKGLLEYDLIEINWDDLGFKPRDIHGVKDSSAGYIFSMGDILTGLIFIKYSPKKDYSHITPIAEEAFKFMSE